MNRRLSLRREHLDELAPADLSQVAGAVYALWFTMHNTCTHCPSNTVVDAIVKTGE